MVFDVTPGHNNFLPLDNLDFTVNPWTRKIKWCYRSLNPLDTLFFCIAPPGHGDFDPWTHPNIQKEPPPPPPPPPRTNVSLVPWTKPLCEILSSVRRGCTGIKWNSPLPSRAGFVGFYSTQSAASFCKPL